MPSMIQILSILIAASCAVAKLHPNSRAAMPLAHTNAEAFALGQRVLAPASFEMVKDAHGRTRSLPSRHPKLAKRAQTSAKACTPFVNVKANIQVTRTDGTNLGYVISGTSGGFSLTNDVTRALTVQLLYNVGNAPTVIAIVNAENGDYPLIGVSSTDPNVVTLGPGLPGFSPLVSTAPGTGGFGGSTSSTNGRAQAYVWVVTCVNGIRAVTATVVDVSGSSFSASIFYDVQGLLGVTGDYQSFSGTHGADASAEVVFSLVTAATASAY